MIHRLKDLITDKISGEWGEEATPTSGVRVIRTANFTNDGIINYDNLVYRDIEPKKIESKKLHFGDIIIEKSGGSPTQPVGRVVFFDLKSSDSFLCNNFTSVLRPNKKLVDPKYLFYRLFEWHKQGKTLRYQNKTTGIINLKLDKYLEEKIEIPDKIEDQIHIANTLSQAEELIRKRKESLDLLDLFLKSMFLEMFGDPVKNEKGWERTELSNLFEVRGRVGWKGYKKTDLRDAGPYVLGATHLSSDGYLDLSKPVYISNEKYIESPEIKVERSDVLIVQRGNTIGKVSIVNEDIGDATINPCILILRPSTGNSYFLKQYLMDENVHQQLWKMNTSSAQPMLTQKDIRAFAIYNPPADLQARFEGITKAIEKMKAHHQRSLMDLKDLYTSISQKAFKGELTFRPETKVISLQTDKKEEDYFKKRKALACYIINQSLDDDKFGDTKFEKLLNLSDQYAIQRNLGQTYYQKVAGPYDNEFTKLFYIQIAAEKLYKRKRRGSQSVFIPDINHKKTFTAGKYFSSDELLRVDRLITYFKKYTYEEPEIISTLYAVWNNRIIRQQQITDEVLKQDFLDWDEKKKKYKDRLDAALAWMKKESIIPNGWGKLIEKPKGKQRKLVVGKKRANSKRAS